MNNAFPRILSLLRSEKHISQKQAAEDLGIAQALLSHYEKGKRECGLDFLVRAADYYNVSTDYILGRSPVRSGIFLTENDIPEGSTTGKADGFSFSSSLAKKLIISSIDVIYSILSKSKNKKLTQSITTILSLGIYKSFRLVYKLNPKNDKNLFIIDEDSAFRAASAGELLAEGTALSAINDTSDNYFVDSMPEGVNTLITTALLESEYNKQAAALLNLIRNSENVIKRYE
ncbi:MAG: helix-turn-helix domain-containing protein [Oscillospiraceae bacterium]|nr:helix-turn-helix domain-containing protein [Oscillospiraceae bacterium]